MIISFSRYEKVLDPFCFSLCTPAELSPPLGVKYDDHQIQFINSNKWNKYDWFDSLLKINLN